VRKIIKMKNIDDTFHRVVNSENWIRLENEFNDSNLIYIIGNGGNLAVADHAAIDISRISSKSAAAPGSGVLASSIINDSGHDEWLKTWLQYTFKNKESFEKALIIGITTSSKSTNVFNALNWAKENGAKTAILAGQPNIALPEDINTVMLDVDHYHTAEVMTLLLFYQLIESSGASCPPIPS
jgi:D-sedoheptulose 7-phosphate isomerase